MEISSWTVDGDALTVALADGSSNAGVIHREHGVIEMDMSGYTFYYGRDGADTEAYLAPGSRLFVLYNSLLFCRHRAGFRLREHNRDLL